MKAQLRRKQANDTIRGGAEMGSRAGSGEPEGVPCSRLQIGPSCSLLPPSKQEAAAL